MTLTKQLLSGMLVLAISATSTALAQGHMHNMQHEQKAPAAAPDTVAATKVEYRCPMDKDVVSDKPGKCPKCGMALKKVTVREASAEHMEHSAKAKEESAAPAMKGADSVNVKHNHDKM